MKRNILILVGIIIVGGSIGLAIWLMQPQQAPSNLPATQSGSGPSVLPDETPANQESASSQVTVRMQNTSFTPATITIKKGTKVTWVNDDFVQHNVVASDSGNSGGLPSQNSLLSKGGSYSFTFDTTGTFDYHCTPHPDMTGTVIVE